MAPEPTILSRVKSVATRLDKAIIGTLSQGAVRHCGPDTETLQRVAGVELEDLEVVGAWYARHERCQWQTTVQESGAGKGSAC